MTRRGAKGHFIALEGGEGVGKSTLARRLKAALKARGIDVLLTREPGGTSGAEAIRGLLLAPPGGQDWTPRAEALLFAAARADHVAKTITPALNAGQWVICDRFLDSSRAYQGGVNGIEDEDIIALHAFGSEGLIPDKTLLLRADPEAVAARLAKRDGASSDAIGGRSADFHAGVAARFQTFAQTAPARFTLIDADQDEAAVERDALAALAPFLPNDNSDPAS